MGLCFPGQGSQAASMAEGLLDLPHARELLRVAAENGLDLERALAGDDDSLRRTEVAQPALFFVETMLAAEMHSPDTVAVAGHSVGEYAACVAAGALSPADGVRLVVERGRAMAAMREGTMCALLGLDAEVAEEVCADASVASGEVVVMANINAPGQVVISGTRAGVDAAVELSRSRGLKRAVPLNVSGAFHSPLMTDAAERFAHVLDDVVLSEATVPIVCNVDAKPVVEAEALRDRLRRQLTSPVRWIDTVHRMVELGAATLVEVGPGSVLTGMARRIEPGATAISLDTLDSVRRYASVAATS